MVGLASWLFYKKSKK
ncbi:hypothetical protein ACPE16_002750 [Enterococcus faecalis]